MLSFTGNGAVRTPSTLQIRLGMQDAGALRAGAPKPSRSMTDSEVVANLRHFTEGRRTTRTRPCTSLVLSGAKEGLEEHTLKAARDLGIERITLHGTGPTSLMAQVDRIVVRCSTPQQVRALASLRRAAIVVPLDTHVVDRLGPIVDAVNDLGPKELLLSWPLPAPDVEVPNVERAVAARSSVRERLRAQIPVRLTGLPACFTGVSSRRTRNRFYVDTEHQLQRALMFFPDIVSFDKPDTCRSCAETAWCDGIARAWLDRGAVGLPQPIASPPNRR